MTARSNALRNPQVGVGSDWTQQSRTQFGPTNMFDGSMLLYMLGTFWRKWFGNSVQLRTLYDGTGQAEYQSYLYFLDAVACLSRFDVPVFSTKNWYYLTLLESDMEVTVPVLHGTSGLEYETKLVPSYGSSGSIDSYAFPVSSELANIPSIMNRVIDPSLVLLNQQDYALVDGKLHFYTDPFDNPFSAIRNVLDADGEVVDRQIAFWLHLSEWDLEYVYNHFGYVLGIWMRSSEYYKDLINALWDNMVLGSTRRAFEMSMEAMTGIRFAVGDEVVTLIDLFGTTRYVITDKNVYIYKDTSTVIVQEGDELLPGQALVDTVQIIEPSAATDWNQLMGISVGAPLLSGNYKSPLVFQNREVPLTYIGIGTDGRARVEFSISGEVTDINEFWRNMRDYSVVNDLTLAEMLDTRVNQVGEPAEKDLPAIINPFEFMMENLLVNNTYVIVVKPADFYDDAPGLSATTHLQRHLPPQTTFLMYINADENVDEYNLTDNVGNIPDIGNSGVYNADAYSSMRDVNLTIRTIPEDCR